MALLLKQSFSQRFNLVTRLLKHECSIRPRLPSKANGFFFSTTATKTAGPAGSSDEAKAVYEKYLVDFKKSYTDPKEKLKRFQIFKQNLKFIELRNPKAGLTALTDVAYEEYCTPNPYLGLSPSKWPRKPTSPDGNGEESEPEMDWDTYMVDNVDYSAEDEEDYVVPNRSEDELKAMYEKYLVDFKRRVDPKDKEMRFETFKESVKRIDDHNSTTRYLYEKEGFSPIIDLPWREYPRHICSHEDDPPSSSGWRTKQRTNIFRIMQWHAGLGNYNIHLALTIEAQNHAATRT